MSECVVLIRHWLYYKIDDRGPPKITLEIKALSPPPTLAAPVVDHNVALIKVRTATRFYLLYY